MIKYQKKPKTDAQVYKLLNPTIADWFRGKFGSFSPPQKFAIPDIKERNNTLISSPTGSGKTLSAFMTVIDELATLAEHGKLEDRIYCIYISPLKALSNDIERNLNAPLKEIKDKFKTEHKKEIDIRVGVRTGDTTPYQRSKMLKTPPHILITTPETLAILLNTKKFREKLIKIDWCIIDEIHSLAEGKRGVHLSLSLERLNRLTTFTRIGLSATVAPLDEVAKYLVGQHTARDNYEGKPEVMMQSRDCNVVDVQFMKGMDMKVISPVENFMDTTHGRMQKNTYKIMHELIKSHKTTLIFTNTRAATERVVHNLKAIYPRAYGEDNIGAHHGSLSKAHRVRIESSLKEGKLKCVVSSTSLELGIDIGNIDLVVLLGSPKSVARALQRIGRAGHALHETAKGRIIVLDRDDLVECGVLLKAAIEKKIDRIKIPKNALDVLAQHIYGMAINGPVHIDEIQNVITRSYCYENLEYSDFEDIINYLSGFFSELEVRHVYAKIWYDKESGMIGSRSKYARIFYMTNIGTIPDTSGVTVKIKDESIGVIDEAFLERLKPGDVFVLGGSTYIFKYTRGMTAQVSASHGIPPTVPSWFSEQLPLSFDLAVEIQKFRKYMEDKFKSAALKKYEDEDHNSKEDIIQFIDEYLYVDKRGAEAIYQYFREQFYYAEIPHYKKLVIEHYKDSHKKYIIFHALFGRRVNDVLSRAIAYYISRIQHKDVEIGINDNGFYVSSSDKIQAVNALRSLEATGLRELMSIILDHTEVLKRRFRHCATRSLMILRRYLGREKSVGRQQMSSHLLISAVRQIDPNFPILREAKREVLEDLMDIKNASEVIDHIQQKNIKIEEIHTDVPTPFAFNLIMQGYTDILRMEDRIEFLKRMHAEVLAKIGIKNRNSNSDDYDDEDDEDEGREKGKVDLHDDYLRKKKEMNQLTDSQEELLDLAALLSISARYKMVLNTMIRGENIENIDFSFFTYLQGNEQEIANRWPKKLAEFVIKKKAEYFSQNFDYETMWKHEDNEKTEAAEEEKRLLKLDFERAARKEYLEFKILEDGFRFIDGETRKFSPEFRQWLKSFVNGSIKMHWSTRISKFLIEQEEKFDW